MRRCKAAWFSPRSVCQSCIPEIELFIWRTARTRLTFLGFTFRPRDGRNKQGRLFTSFQPGASNEATKRMRQTVREWRLHRQTPGTVAELAQQYNPVIRGWWNYY